VSSPHKAEFRRYRQAVWGLTFGTTAIIVAWLIASVAHALFARPAVQTSSTAGVVPGDDVDVLLACQADVESLFDTLNRKLFDLQALGARYDIQRAEQWEAFSKRWRQRRQEVGARCRFDELRNRNPELGATYDRLQVVYDELDEVQRAYAVLLYNYIDHHASRVDDIRHALETSRKALEAVRAARGGAPRDAG
jgi:hypothetical protein